jgi:glucose-6-phosphate isomerase
MPIPGQAYSFGVLEEAQALGDYQALTGRGRRVLRICLEDVGLGLQQLAELVERLQLPAAG